MDRHGDWCDACLVVGRVWIEPSLENDNMRRDSPLRTTAKGRKDERWSRPMFPLIF